MTDDSFLERMARTSRARVELAIAEESETALRARAMVKADPPKLAFGEFDLIAELKLRSPAAGSLAKTGFDREAQLDAYARGGAATISVLTEPDEFKGALSHLEEAATLLEPRGVPAMRKDFLTDPYQVLEARFCWRRSTPKISSESLHWPDPGSRPKTRPYCVASTAAT